jgi:multiple sugar transport system permease protein
MIDGAGLWQRTRHVTIPLLTPVIFFNLIMGIIGAFQYFAQAYIMTQGGPEDSTTFYALYLFNRAWRYLDMGYASAMAWVLFVVIVALTVLVFRTQKRWVHYGG